jgi:N-acetylglucosamine-6-phosphate deacetylase
MRIEARHYRTGQRLHLVCEQDRVKQSANPQAGIAADLTAEWIAPAFCDIQINGCDGFSFNSPELRPEQVRHVVTVCQRHGIAQLCPTLVTGPYDALAHGFRTLRQVRAADAELQQAIVGLHLEGPYIAAEDGPRGAHPRAHVRPPDWDEFCRLQEAAGGLIRVLTLAPELPGAIAFIERVVQSGVVVALGHTAASGPVLRDAVRAGARLSTHLGNGAHAVLPRHPNYIWEQLADDGLWASLICDGHHLPLSVLRCFVRVKTAARLILTCDAGTLAGLPPGRYPVWDQEFEVHPEGKIVVPGTNYLAGSWALTDHCVRTLLRLNELAPADVLDLAGARPRELLGLPPRRMEAGEPADFVLYDGQGEGDFRLRATVVGGRVVAC